MATAKRKLSTVQDILADVARARGSTRTSAVEADPKFADMAANPFYQVMFNEKLAPKQRAEEFAKLMEFQGTKEASRQRVAEQEHFKEYLQHVREEMALEIIALTNTDAFAQLKDTYNHLNQGLIDFENQMGPLTDIIDAVYKLRTSGMTLDAFRTIIEDKKREEARTLELGNLENNSNLLKKQITDADQAIAVLRTKKKLWGLGGISQDAKEAIATREVDRKQLDTELSDIQNKVTQLEAEAPPPDERGEEFTKQKEQLRELLDISSEEHKARQVALVTAAVDFVKTSKKETGSIKDHLGQMNGQIEGLADANDNMSGVYAVMQEGGKIADTHNREQLAKVSTPAPDEDAVTKIARESKKLAIDQHIKTVETTMVDTMTTLADLTSQAIRVKGMRDNNADNMNTARILHSQGVAGVADRLSTVLQAVSMAALGESSAMAGQTLQKMRDSTNAVTQKEAIRTAMGVTEQSDALSKVIDDLAGYGEVINTATDITKEGLAEMRTRMQELEELATSVRESTQKAYAVNSDTIRPDKEPKIKASALDEKKPFGNLGRGI